MRMNRQIKKMKKKNLNQSMKILLLSKKDKRIKFIRSNY